MDMGSDAVIGMWLAIAAFIVSAGTLMVAGLGGRDAVRKSYVDDLAGQIKLLRHDVARYKDHADECDRQLKSLKEDHVMLMRQLLRDGGPSRKS